MSTLLFWQGRGGRNGTTGAGSPAPGGGSRTWLHAPDLLLKGHVAYLVKFLGSTTVEQPKGIEVVKDAIRRLQFTQQLRKSETGAKTRKVEITISVDGVAIQEPRTNNILHQFPLHRISYCADDKEAKKFFSFIAKGETGGGPGPLPGSPAPPAPAPTNGSAPLAEQHECFVFVSNKLASEITLTIGQAFDLAYRRFLMERGAGAEAVLQDAARARARATEMAARARELAALLPPAALRTWLASRGLGHATEWTPEPDPGLDTKSIGSTQDNLFSSSPPVFSNNNHIVDLMNTSIDMSTPTKNPSVGTKLEGLLLNSDSDSDFDPRALESEPPAVALNASRPRANQTTSPTHNGLTPPPLLAPPPKANKRSPTQSATNGLTNGSNSDLFGSAPFAIPPAGGAAAPAAPAGRPQPSNAPNYNLSDFSSQASVFPPSGSATNGTSGMVGFDPFDTGKIGAVNGNYNGSSFSNPMDAGSSGNSGVSNWNYNAVPSWFGNPADVASPGTNGASNGSHNGVPSWFSNPMDIGMNLSNNGSHGFGNAFPCGDIKNNLASLDSGFSGFLDKRVSEMKVGNF